MATKEIKFTCPRCDGHDFQIVSVNVSNAGRRHNDITLAFFCYGCDVRYDLLMSNASEGNRAAWFMHNTREPVEQMDSRPPPTPIPSAGRDRTP